MREEQKILIQDLNKLHGESSDPESNDTIKEEDFDDYDSDMEEKKIWS